MTRRWSLWLSGAVLCLLAAEVSVAAMFWDMNADSLEGRAAEEVARLGIMQGYPGGSFRGTQDVTRGEAAAAIVRASNRSLNGGNRRFRDVDARDVLAPFIDAAVQQGIADGYRDGTFRPHQAVTTAEVIAMIARAFGGPKDLPYSYIDVYPRDWYARYAGFAERQELFPYRSSYLLPHVRVTRSELAIALLQALDRSPSRGERSSVSYYSPTYRSAPSYYYDRPTYPDDARPVTCGGGYSCTAHPYAYQCAMTTFNCGPNHVADCRDSCGTEYCRGTCCKCIPRYRSSSSSSRSYVERCAPNSFCTAYPSGNRCAMASVDCGAGSYLQCEGSCGNDSCRGRCCLCQRAFTPASSSSRSSSASSAGIIGCGTGYSCTAFPSGNQCAMTSINCGSGFATVCIGTCGTESCSGNCCTCIPQG